MLRGSSLNAGNWVLECILSAYDVKVLPVRERGRGVSLNVRPWGLSCFEGVGVLWLNYQRGASKTVN